MKRKTLNAMRSLRFPFLFILLLWVVRLFEELSHLEFGWLGIYPREVIGLRGIITAPVIHGDWQHLISNTVPLAALSLVIFLFYRRVAVKSFILIYLLTGLAVWCFGRPVFHIGASGVVYGLVAFVFWSGIFRRSAKAIVLALVILIMYSGYFLGIVPGEPGISWESHLLGALVGIFVAYLFKNTLEYDEEEEEPMLEESDPEGYLLPRDAFEKTMAQREAERRFWHSDRTRY